MNKKQILDLIARAIQYADKQDTEDEQTRPLRAQGDARRMERMTSILIALQVDLEKHAPGAGSSIKEFLGNVIYARNPLLDTADSNKETPE